MRCTRRKKASTVEAHGGSLVCLGGSRGARFRLVLPAASAVATREADDAVGAARGLAR